MKHKYQHPTALVAQPRLYDLLTASGELPPPGGDPANPGSDTFDPDVFDPAAPDLDWD